MVSGKNSKAVRNARAAVVARRSTPWGMIAAVIVVVLFAGVDLRLRVRAQTSANAGAKRPRWPRSRRSRHEPGPVDRDRRRRQVGAVRGRPARRSRASAVAYTHSPPFGGTHDGDWAACNGVVYPNRGAQREHGALAGARRGVDRLQPGPGHRRRADDADARRSTGQPYTLMSPYPGLDQPISLQSWGHQLKLADAERPADRPVHRVAAAATSTSYPEPGASCDELGPRPVRPGQPAAVRARAARRAVNNTPVDARGHRGGAGRHPRPGQ